MELIKFALFLILPFSLLSAAPTMGPLSTTASPAALDQAGHLRQISSGLHVLDTIALKRLSATLQTSNASSSHILVPHYGLGENLTAWNTTALMCKQHSLLSALWEIPSADVDESIVFTRTVTQLLMKHFCKWSESFLQSMYPFGSFSITCTAHHVGKICSDLETVTFSSKLQGAILRYNSSISHDSSDVGQWIDSHLLPSAFLPGAFQLINSTRTVAPSSLTAPSSASK